jgi:HSP20 family molecular chaperone IbpA
MARNVAGKGKRTGEKLKIFALDPKEQSRRVRNAVARQAFKIFETRGSAPSHELEDWRQAESQLMGSRTSGQMRLEGTLWVASNAAIFEEDTIEIWVAPRRITICGKPRVTNANATSKRGGPVPQKEMIFHVIDLTCGVDPSQVTARIVHGSSLELQLKRAEAEPRLKSGVKTAGGSTT